MTLGNTDIEVRPQRQQSDALTDLMTLIVEPSVLPASHSPREKIQTEPVACRLVLAVGIGNHDFAKLLALSKRCGVTLVGVGGVNDALEILGLHEPAIILLSSDVTDGDSQRRVLEATKSICLLEPYIVVCDQGFFDQLDPPISRSMDAGRAV